MWISTKGALNKEGAVTNGEAQPDASGISARRGLLGAIAGATVALLSSARAARAAADDGSALMIGNTGRNGANPPSGATAQTSNQMTELQATISEGALPDPNDATTWNSVPAVRFSVNVSQPANATAPGLGTQPGVQIAASVPMDDALAVQNFSSDRAVGMSAYSRGGDAIQANSDGGNGISAQTTSGLSGQAAVLGKASGIAVGLWGEATNGYAVYGRSTNNHGVVGSSTGGVGVVAASENNWGLYGFSINSIGIRGDSVSSYSGQFYGGLGVYIFGDLTVTGAKSAAVPFADGSLRRVHCLESPEAWFEDFGQARLEGGRAHVKLDAGFAQIVRTDDYHVFLTPRGNCKGLYVSHQDEEGFEVREHDGKSTLLLSYRVVALRKDVAHARLERVMVPSAAAPEAVTSILVPTHRAD